MIAEIEKPVDGIHKDVNNEELLVIRRGDFIYVTNAFYI